MWKTIWVFFFVYFVVWISCDPTQHCCKFQIDSHRHIDLTPLQYLNFWSPVAYYPNHNVTLTLCRNLDPENDCALPPGSLHDSTPAKDEYHSTLMRTSSCFNVGGVAECVFGNFNPDTGTAVLEYPGLEPEEGFYRNIQITTHCVENKHQNVGRLDCFDIVHKDFEYTYECDFYSYHACVIDDKKNMILEDIYIVIAVALAVILCLLIPSFFVTLVVLAIAFSMVVKRKKREEQAEMGIRSRKKETLNNPLLENRIKSENINIGSGPVVEKVDPGVEFDEEEDYISGLQMNSMNAVDLNNPSFGNDSETFTSCCYCKKRKCCVMYVPCRHLCQCSECPVPKKCNICNRKIKYKFLTNLL